MEYIHVKWFLTGLEGLAIVWWFQSVKQSVVLAIVLEVCKVLLLKVVIWPHVMSPLRHVPGPYSNWIYGHSIFAEEYGFAAADGKASDGERHFRWHEKYGGFVKFLSFLGVRAGCAGCGNVALIHQDERLSITDTRALAEIINRPEDFPKPEWFDKIIARSIGNSVLVSRGERHKLQRKILQPMFTINHLRELVPLMYGPIHSLMQFWEEKLGDDKASGTLEVTMDCDRTMLDIMGLAGFGIQFDTLRKPDHEYAKNYKVLFSGTDADHLWDTACVFLPVLVRLPIFRPAKLARAVKGFDRESYNLIDIKRAQHDEQSRDLLSLMLAQQKVDAEGMSDKDIVEQTFAAAGHETVSTASAWALHFLSLNQDLQDRLYDEVSAEVFNHGDAPTFENIDRCKLLNNTTREILRYESPASVLLRCAGEDCQLGPYNVPKDTVIHISPTAINRSTENWGAHDEFDPDRWNTLPESPYAFLTFMEGSRKCIGWRFAILELKIFIASLINNFRIDRGQEVVEKYSRVTTKPKDGLLIQFEKRR